MNLSCLTPPARLVFLLAALSALSPLAVPDDSTNPAGTLLVPRINTAPGDEPLNELLTFTLENDFFLGQGGDDAYSNGWRIMWTTDRLERYEEDYLPRDVSEAFSFLPFLGDEGYHNRFTFAFGQVMATPEDITLKNPPPNAQPYFGLLFCSGALIAHTEDIMHTYEAMVGVTGNASLAEETQTIFHRVFGAKKPEGWDHQVHTEPVLNLSYRLRYRLLDADLGLGWSFDMISHTNGSLGNMITQAEAGAVLRLGYNMPHNFGPNIILFGLESQLFAMEKPEYEGTIEFFCGFNGSLVGRNMALDGNTFKDYGRDVKRKPFVQTFLVGVGYRNNDFGITLNWLCMSKMFEGQKEDSDFASIGIHYNF